MATETLRSVQGDTLDGLIWRERRLGPADLADVIALNPGLAAKGEVLPLGSAVIVLVREPTTATRPLIQLWD